MKMTAVLRDDLASKSFNNGIWAKPRGWTSPAHSHLVYFYHFFSLCSSLSPIWLHSISSLLFSFCSSLLFIPVLASHLPQLQPYAVTPHFLTASVWLCQVVFLCWSTVAMVRLCVRRSGRVCVFACKLAAMYTHSGVNYSLKRWCWRECEC